MCRRGKNRRYCSVISDNESKRKRHEADRSNPIIETIFVVVYVVLMFELLHHVLVSTINEAVYDVL